MSNFGFRDRDRAATEFIDDCVAQADADRRPREPGWKENWANYRVEPMGNAGVPNKTYPYASGGAAAGVSPVNFLKTPESHQGVNTLRSLLLAGLFGTRDYVQADPVGDEDVDAAKKVSRLVMYGLERPGNFRTNWELLGDSLITGLGSYSARWKRITRLVPRRLPVPDPSGLSPDGWLRNPDTGGIMTVLKNVEAHVHDDPSIETDDIWDTWYDPSANRFNQVNWKVTRFRVRDEELESFLEDPNWDAEGIAVVLGHEPNESSLDKKEKAKLITENLTLDDIKSVSAFGYYGGWMYEGTIPKAIAEEIGGIDHRGTVILRVINGILIQAIQSPQRDGLIQGGVITILPTGQGVYGLSPLTVVRYLQDVSDTQLILTVQALIESVYQNYLIGGDAGPTFARDLETRRPREVFTLQGEIDQVAPLPKDYQGLQIATGALSLISQTIRNAMNARDPIQGIQQQGETTATESQLVSSAALQNTDQLAMLIERDELPQMGKLINDLFYVNLDDEGKVFKRTGDRELTNVSYYDIDATSDIAFVGARSLLSKTAKANQMRDFFSLLASQPLIAASVDWHEAVRRYGDEALDVRGLEHLMIQDPEEILARLQSMGLASGGAPAEKGRATPGNGGATGANSPAQGAGEAS